MKKTFLAISSAGPNRDSSKDTREQPFWDDHAKFIDQLVDDGLILMGGPLVDEGGALLVFNAEDENEAGRGQAAQEDRLREAQATQGLEEPSAGGEAAEAAP